LTPVPDPQGFSGDKAVIRVLPTLTTPDTWRTHARCRGVDPLIFHPLNEEDAAEDAKAICELCPVREACLEYAISAREKDGVWGGLTARERRRVIRQRRRSA
jgi:WhiB family redox-sensing transcriptional regulator